MKNRLTIVSLIAAGFVGLAQVNAQRDNRSHEENVVSVVGNE